jgi:hypothetical protein
MPTVSPVGYSEGSAGGLLEFDDSWSQYGTEGKKNYSPGRGQAAKPRAQALGNVGINEVALQGRYSLFRPSRALYIMPNISQAYALGFVAWPFRAISGTAALSGTKIKPPTVSRCEGFAGGS